MLAAARNITRRRKRIEYSLILRKGTSCIRRRAQRRSANFHERDQGFHVAERRLANSLHHLPGRGVNAGGVPLGKLELRHDVVKNRSVLRDADRRGWPE